MHITEYQQEAMKYDITKNHIKSIRIEHMMVGCMEELGEIAALRKRQIRENSDISQHSLRLEIGDLLWYVTGLAESYGLGLNEIAEYNLTKLADRRARNAIQGKGDNR